MGQRPRVVVAMSLIGRAALFVLKEAARPALEKFGEHVGEAVGTCVRRRIDRRYQQAKKDESKDE